MTSWAGKKAALANLRRKYGSRCAYCGIAVGRWDHSIDHHLPIALGGMNEFENLRLSCRPCNAKKGSMHPRDWERIKPRYVVQPEPTRITLLVKIARRARAKSNPSDGGTRSD